VHDKFVEILIKSIKSFERMFFYVVLYSTTKEPIQMENSIDNLNLQKETILQQIKELDDFRQGSLSPRYRKCGKPYCHCAKEGSKGHWMITRSVKGKTISKEIPKEKVDTTFKQIEMFHSFQKLIHDYIETSINICDLQLEQDKKDSKEAEKKGSTQNYELQ